MLLVLVTALAVCGVGKPTSGRVAMLTSDEIERMRREHVMCQRCSDCPELPHCISCFDDDFLPIAYPCDAAKLLAEFAPVSAPFRRWSPEDIVYDLEPLGLTPRMAPIDRLKREAGIHVGICGPTTMEELAR